MTEIIINQLSQEELESKGVFQWPIWECEISEFPWTYPEKETCYIIEGEIEVKTDDNVVNIKPGDFVVFSAGLSCAWNVLVPVKKHYKFGSI